MRHDPQLAPLVGTPCEKAFKSSFRTELGQKTLDLGSVKAALPSVELNPRYGSWDPEHGINLRGGSISVEAKS